MAINFNNKWVVITGASSGIGKALTECFAREGAHLILGSLPGEKHILEGIKDHLQKQYAIQAVTIYQDFAKPDGAEKFYDQCKKLQKQVYCLVNNAGIIAYGYFYELSHKQQQTLITINLMAYFSLMRLFIDDMIQQKEGVIINISSVSAFQPTPHHAVYGAVKAFVQSLSEAVDQECRGTGVSVHTINPSYTDTPLLKKNNFPDKIWWYHISGLAKPEDIARKAIKAVKKGKRLYVPGPMNTLIHLFLPRLLPRKLSNTIANIVLRQES
jgi:short-subunit dehydrogenase